MLTEKTYILCILSVLQIHSDADHILSIKDLIQKIHGIYDIHVDRRTIYRNIAHLIQFGYDISTFEDNKKGYYLRERDFEPSELRLLADAVLTADFIPEGEGRSLIRKLQSLGSVHQTRPLNRLSGVKVNKKSPNKEIFFNIEELDEAIRAGRQVAFEYVSYDIDLVQKPKRKERYVVNPYALYLTNGQYYLISNMPPHEGICHFRLDRIKKIAIIETPAQPVPNGIDVYDYAKNALYMFGGETETFTIRCDRTVLNDVVDRFGDKIVIIDSDETTFTTVVKATTQGMRLWAGNYLSCCTVLSPQWLVEDITAMVKKGMDRYGLSSIRERKE
jgi:predicted DNA-binding transcriptional regulator YafY